MNRCNEHRTLLICRLSLWQWTHPCTPAHKLVKIYIYQKADLKSSNEKRVSIESIVQKETWSFACNKHSKSALTFAIWVKSAVPCTHAQHIWNVSYHTSHWFWNECCLVRPPFRSLIRSRYWLLNHICNAHATYRVALPHTATHCNTLQHAATYCT